MFGGDECYDCYCEHDGHDKRSDALTTGHAEELGNFFYSLTHRIAEIDAKIMKNKGCSMEKGKKRKKYH